MAMIDADAVKTDVAILGAGPAGSTLAALLVRKGVSVVIVDRDAFPRDKVCGEFLSYDVVPILEAMGVLRQIDDLGAEPIRRCRVVLGSLVHEFEFPQPARGISRYNLDDLLLSRAAEYGARRYDGWTAERVQPGDKPLVTIRSEDGEVQTIAPKIVVGAWGRWGRIDRHLGRAFTRDRVHRHYGFKRHYRRRPGDADTITLYPFDRGYLGVSSVEDDQTNICGLVHMNRLMGLRGGWEKFTEILGEERPEIGEVFESSEPAQEHFLSSDPVIFAAKSPLHQNIVMVGDAAGLIDPLAGDGMAIGIQSALLAAGSIFQKLQGGRIAEGALERYEQSWKAWFEGRIRWSRSIAWLLCQPFVLGLTMKTIRTPRAGRLFLNRTRAEMGTVERLVESWFQG